MARIRSIKPETWSDQRLARISRDARLLYIALWNFSDEQGRMVGDPRQVKGLCLPMDDDLGPSEIDTLLDELGKAGRVVRYIADDELFLYLPHLSKHQRLDDKQESRFPEPPDDPAFPRHESEVSPEKSGEVHRDPGEVRPRARAYVAGSKEHVAGFPPSAGREIATATAPQTLARLPTAQTAVALYVDAYRAKAGHDPPRRITGQIAREVADMLKGGVPFDAVTAGMRVWLERDQHPSTLASFVEVEARGGQPRASPTRAGRDREQMLATAREMDLIGEVMNGDVGRVERDRAEAQRELPQPADPY